MSAFEESLAYERVRKFHRFHREFSEKLSVAPTSVLLTLHSLFKHTLYTHIAIVRSSFILYLFIL